MSLQRRKPYKTPMSPDTIMLAFLCGMALAGIVGTIAYVAAFGY